MNKILFAAALALGLGTFAFAQSNDDLTPANDSNNVPVYRVTVTERSTLAVDYRHKGGTSKLDLVGTTLMPQADGHAEVKAHTGRVEVEAHFDHLEPAHRLGPQYLTYVLWAITPEGRPVNLGEVILKHHHDRNAEIHVTSNLQAFGMIVTAEPYYAVTHPSDEVVMEAQVGPDVKAEVQPIHTRYEALGRNEYIVDLNPADLPAFDDATPLTILEAENAIAIAKATGASQYAEASLQRAEDQLAQAEAAYRAGRNETEVGTPARSATQMAEDARVIAIRRKHDDEVARERAENHRRAEEARARADAEAARAQEAQLDAQKAEADRAAAVEARQQADAAAEQARLDRQQADDARRAAEAQQAQLAAQTQAAQLQAQQADQARAAAEAQVAQTRARLTDQLNQVLQTRQTARGLIVNMNDVLFDSGHATLKPGARVRLAKVAGIIMAYPDLKLEIDGYTDSTGSQNFNQELSQQRADAVRSFLTSQGVPDSNIVTRGYGQEDPIASNDSASGRQLNRRVELVVSGNAIGTNAAVPPPAAQPSAIGGNVNPQ